MDDELRSRLDDKVKEFYVRLENSHTNLAVSNNIITMQELRYYAAYVCIMRQVSMPFNKYFKDKKILEDKRLQILIDYQTNKLFSEYVYESIPAIETKIQRLEDIMEPYMRMDLLGYRLPPKN